MRALRAIPFHFTSPIVIEGIEATDLFSMNTLLGGAIETQTVTILNSLRAIWDPEGEWANYEFVRFPESFPDVRLVRSRRASETPLIGIELKGWYLLSKERMPSFRFSASPMAASPWDLLVCFPWALSNVLSGKPALYEPFIENARYAAAMRNHYWLTKGRDRSRNAIEHPRDAHPYPSPRSNFHDRPIYDGGGNFGRIARVKGLMGDWIAETLSTPMAGIGAGYWIRFFSLFSEARSDEEVRRELDRIEDAIRAGRIVTVDVDLDFVNQLRRIAVST